MPNLERWTEQPAPTISPVHRAVAAWRRINDRPAAIVVVREGVEQPLQIVRVEVKAAAPIAIETGAVPVQTVVVYGVVGHPSSPEVPDTSLMVGDRFHYGGQWFEIDSVVLVPGEVQGFGKAQKFGP